MSVATRRVWRSPRWYLAGGLALLLTLAWLSGKNGRGVFRPSEVRVAYNRFPPYVDEGSGGVPVGFGAEMLLEAARRAHIEIRWVQIEGAADEAFAAGKADMYPLTTITPQRQARFYMSPPWWENQFVLVSTRNREIPDAAAARGKTIANRIGVIQTFSRRLLPGAHFVEMTTLAEMEAALCAKKVDGFFSDVRLLQTQLLQRTTGCAGQVLSEISIPDSRLFLGTASTKAMASVNDRIFREIAKLALDGTLAGKAARSGVFTPYDTSHLKEVVDAEADEKLIAWVLAATLLVLALSLFQTNAIRRARRAAESAQAEAKEMQHRFDEFMKHTPAITFIKDEKGRVIYSNEESGPGNSISPRLSCRDGDVFASGHGVEVTETLRDADGTQRHFLVLKFPFRGAAGAHLLGGVALDVTARILAEKELEFHARNDLLTGLPNRRSFMTELELALRKSPHREARLAVGFVDLDGFKQVNDLMGHEAGDELLKHVAMRLKRVCGEADMLARMGGDEFTFFLRDVTPASTQRYVATALRALKEPFWIGGKEVLISASIGVSLFPEHGATPQQLLRHADSAMYRAKRNGKGRVEFWSRFNGDRQSQERAPISVAS
jgi:diguanylate cyclase (GGDEF)-like protein